MSFTSWHSTFYPNTINISHQPVFSATRMFNLDEEEDYNYGYGPPVDVARVAKRKSTPQSPKLSAVKNLDAKSDGANERLAMLLDRYHNPRDFDDELDAEDTLDYSPRTLSPRELSPAPVVSKPKRSLKSAFDFQTKPSAIFQSITKGPRTEKETRRRNVLGIPIKERDPDLIARMIRDRSISVKPEPSSPKLGLSDTRSSRSPSGSGKRSLPKPEDYGVPRRRRSSFREVPDYSESNDSSDSQRLAKNMGRMFNNSWRWLTGGATRYPGSETINPYKSGRSRSRSRGHVTINDTNSGMSGPFALISDGWIRLLEAIPVLGFLLAIIPEGPLKTPVVLLEIFMSLWALYYMILLLEVISSVVKAVCSPAIFLASFLTGKRR